MEQGFIINGDLNGLEVVLAIKEDGKPVRYAFALEPDRSTCVITREVLSDDGEPLSHQTWIRTLEEAKDDQGGFAPAVIWILRGLWGIPLEFGPKIEAPVVVMP